MDEKDDGPPSTPDGSGNGSDGETKGGGAEPNRNGSDGEDEVDELALRSEKVVPCKRACVSAPVRCGLVVFSVC